MEKPDNNFTEILLGLGSNIEPRRQYLDDAIEKLGIIPDCEIVRKSSIRETAPLGPGTHNYLNMAVLMNVMKISPEEFLKYIHNIENYLGRVRTVRWGDRTVDIDILFWGNAAIRSENLIIPHPQLQYRKFVLDPLYEIVPYLIHPVLLKSVSELRSELYNES
ncbi:MAG: 2-amino-4-hydroxy-6-hydroxymethyldihydropteridine diphosphokinase [Deltaproteobacteria bacterium]|nr:2-amino-4-hydroxy-6-hydroxymethyldihydropteridine diphosphokinase [Deltaproteobacteria bacterium]